MATNDSESIIQRPSVKLEHVAYWKPGNKCDGRGKKSASSRGYNAERLAQAALYSFHFPLPVSLDSWHDTFLNPTDDSALWVEAKSCISRYPSGQYGRFRIWKRNHDALVKRINNPSYEPYDDGSYGIYFFVVYRIKYGLEEEVGKMVVPVNRVDSIIDSWSEVDHSTMGKCKYRDLSWNHLLTELDVSREEFKSADAIDLTAGKQIL